MVSVNTNHEMSVAGWTVRGILQTGGHESPLGGAKYSLKAPNCDTWLPRNEELPAKVREPISLAKIKIKEILRARLAQAVAKATKTGTKRATKPKAAQSKAFVKKPAAKAAKVGAKASTKPKTAKAKLSTKLVKKPAGKK
mmetsp:Transcript_59551/g.118021  ORF Transcript_59551/g.118021 Transcript_59551/m.118021 type:complete len:140 (-) Transcript_59551:197-616(-)|eukprot:CAMPEP_0172659320 /NCGR_PEP_ID=MMETSP1074-20121228/3358_1 /TAXON_ID=2916 /ORGANISM="Ceratium fusus, Strain PA161109" /LENGTH=139 /DNA_ID=CAMNT_0013474783 /DNA_START=66 /DNA_END=485 /DNA_ORIENTATION=-